jgi:hypothetical protein
MLLSPKVDVMWSSEKKKKKKKLFHAPYTTGDHAKSALGDKNVMYDIIDLENNVGYNNVICIVV